MLHIVKHHHSLAEALHYAAEDDVILLTEDGIYATLPDHKSCPQVSPAQKIYCLSADVVARGVKVSDKKAANKVEMIDFAGFVELTELHASSLTWD